MSQKKAKKSSGGGSGAPAWMVTYSDLVTLLLTFFVLLLSMSRLDQLKLTKAAGSLKQAFGSLNAGQKTDLDTPRIVKFAPMVDDLHARLYVRMQTKLKSIELNEHMKLVKDRGAIILRIEDTILFKPGSADLSSEAKQALRPVAEMIADLPLSLRIEGHTDNIKPAKSGYSNWRLSVDRSVSVLELFAEEKLIPLSRMSTVGYGDTRPLADNDTPENRAKNRRVEFVLESIGDQREELPYLIDAGEALPF